MAMTWTFGFTNGDTGGTQTGPDYQLKSQVLNVVDNYALKQDEPTDCQLTNKTAPVDQPEIISYQSSVVKNFPKRTNITYPGPNSDNIMYGVRLDELLRGISDNDSMIVDLPIVMNLSIKHPLNAAIDNQVIDLLFRRLVSACYYQVKGSGDMVYTSELARFEDLMKSALKPTRN